MKPIPTFILALAAAASFAQAEPLQISGVYPHLTMRNDEGECGTGAVVPWQGHLYAITYAPHAPAGSSDKLYVIHPDLEQEIYEGSVGGTPANRLIHDASKQLLIGPYLVDAEREIRVIPPSRMYGRLTGTATHLTDPDKVYYATMEQGLYEVDVNTLEVNCLIRDRHPAAPEEGVVTDIPGDHGKGLYSGQGRVIYSNNGEKAGAEKREDPTITAGALAEWTGEGDWRLVRRNQFTEISGPGGIRGNAEPGTDPVWAMGWDARSLILGLLEEGTWHYYRLPKGSHSYDGSHGWNTEWPRIREIGEEDLLATMHGTFWRFPADFGLENSAGLAPRSNYLKVVGDFCRWNDRVVLGCDDSAKSEFLNRRPFKAEHGAPLQSNSNIWFVKPERLDELGPAIGRGSVWLREDLESGQTSEPYLFAGYDMRQLTLTHGSAEPVEFLLEVDRDGTNQWEMLREISVPAGESRSEIFPAEESGAWIRLTCREAATGVTAHFHYRNEDTRTTEADARFAGIATRDAPAASYGLMRSLAHDRLGLAAASGPEGEDLGWYELNPQMELVAVDRPGAAAELVDAVRQPEGSVTVDAASVLVVEDGKRFRLPKSPDFPDSPAKSGFGAARICREVATERDLLNVHGTFYELPARNAQGMAKVRPIASHGLAVHDFCSHNGLLLFTGVDAETESEHIFRSADGKAAVWAGVVDDLWELGKPRGIGGPWKDAEAKAGVPSDPYLMTAYDEKSVQLEASAACRVTLEVDIDGTGLWVPWKTFSLRADETEDYTFPEGFSAYWVRATSDRDATLSVQFEYR